MVKKAQLAILLLLVVILFASKNGHSTINLGVAKDPNLPIHALEFFDQDTFFAGVAQAEKEGKVFPDHVYGGIIPHHLFPGFIITDFFSRLATQNPETIILLGPNHYEKGNSKVLASSYGWETPFGEVYPETEIIDNLQANNLLTLNETVVPKEHSVAGMMPFIKYYLPETKVVPLVLSGRLTKTEIELLVNNLKDYINEDTIVVAAVDFSHYQVSKEAQSKDITTLTLITNHDYDGLLALGNDYLDSPPSIVAVLMAMQDLEKTNMEVLQRTNSGILQKNEGIETTSYFSIVYF